MTAAPRTADVTITPLPDRNGWLVAIRPGHRRAGDLFRRHCEAAYLRGRGGWVWRVRVGEDACLDAFVGACRGDVGLLVEGER